VQVALEPPPGLVGGLDHPRARRAQLVDPGAELRFEPRALDFDARGRGQGPHELGVARAPFALDQDPSGSPSRTIGVAAPSSARSIGRPAMST
jgi:hypothetical protein